MIFFKKKKKTSKRTLILGLILFNTSIFSLPFLGGKSLGKVILFNSFVRSTHKPNRRHTVIFNRCCINERMPTKMDHDLLFCSLVLEKERHKSKLILYLKFIKTYFCVFLFPHLIGKKKINKKDIDR